MRVIQCRLDVINSGVWHATPFEYFEPFLRGSRLCHLLYKSLQLYPVLDPIAVRHELWVCRPLWLLDSLAQYAEELVIPTAQEDIAIGGLEAFVGNDGRCVC
jgi:hypothetical protein